MQLQFFIRLAGVIFLAGVPDTIFTETLVKETPIVQPQEQEGSEVDFAHLHTPCVLDGKVYTMNNISSVPQDHTLISFFVDEVNMTFPAECTYGLQSLYARSFTNFMGATLFGNCISPSTIVFDGDPEDFNDLRCEPWWLKGLTNKGNASFTSINQTMEAIVNAATGELRKQGTGVRFFSAKNDTHEKMLLPVYVKGTVMETTVCIKFNWMWPGFPLALLALTILLLGISCGKMYFDTLKIPAWKSSILPLLLTGNQIGATAVAEDMDKTKADTDNLVVSLAHLERGWEFVVEGYEERKKKDS